MSPTFFTIFAFLPFFSIRAPFCLPFPAFVGGVGSAPASTGDVGLPWQAEGITNDSGWAGRRQNHGLTLIRQKAEPLATSPAGVHEDFSPFSYGYREF